MYLKNYKNSIKLYNREKENKYNKNDKKYSSADFRDDLLNNFNDYCSKIGCCNVYIHNNIHF